MDCQQADRYILDYCDQNLPSNITNKLEEHLQNCQDCNSNYRLTLLENEVLTGKQNIPWLNDNFTSQVMKKIIANDPNNVANMVSSAPNEIWIEPKKNQWKNKILGAITGISVLAVLFLMITISQALLKKYEMAQMSDRTNPPANTVIADKTPVDNTPRNSSQNIEQNTEIANTNPSPNSTKSVPTDNLTTGTGAVSQSAPIDNKAYDASTQAAAPLTKRADLASTAVERGTRDPYPVSLPEEYKLLNYNTSNSVYTYNYRSSTTNKELQLTFRPADDNSDNSANTRQSFAAQEKVYSISWYVTYNGIKYKIDLSGNVTADELARLASNISLK